MTVLVLQGYLLLVLQKFSACGVALDGQSKRKQRPKFSQGLVLLCYPNDMCFVP